MIKRIVFDEVGNIKDIEFVEGISPKEAVKAIVMLREAMHRVNTEYPNMDIIDVGLYRPFKLWQPLD